MPTSPWYFYIIANGHRTYAGVSPYPERRLRQHNGEIKGGAKYTTSAGSGWKHVCLIQGFRTNIEALQFEWAVKHEKPRGKGGIESRLRKLHRVLNKERWTSKAPKAGEVPLHIQWLIEPAYTEELPDYVCVEYNLGTNQITAGNPHPDQSSSSVD